MPENSQDELERYITERDPLGPIRGELIKSPMVAAKLFDPHNKTYNPLLDKDVSVVLGPRGSGKTALLRNYKYRQYLPNKKESKIFGSD